VLLLTFSLLSHGSGSEHTRFSCEKTFAGNRNNSTHSHEQKEERKRILAAVQQHQATASLMLLLCFSRPCITTQSIPSPHTASPDECYRHPQPPALSSPRLSLLTTRSSFLAAARMIMRTRDEFVCECERGKHTGISFLLSFSPPTVPACTHKHTCPRPCCYNRFPHPVPPARDTQTPAAIPAGYGRKLLVPIRKSRPDR
jgi:hypothetical protein